MEIGKLMLFNSPVFLFLFLPLFLLAGFLIFKVGAFQKVRNLYLVLASLFFYAWGEPTYILVLIASIIGNYVFSLLINSASRFKRQTNARLWLGLAVACNLALLISFKYSHFLINTLNSIHSSGLAFPQFPLPLGISFFTFSAISYLIDIYRKNALFERNPIYVTLYISFFPKLLAGPIVQYSQIKDQFKSPEIGLGMFSEGIQRFIVGLGKKVLIANTLSVVADQIFAVPSSQLTLGISWLGIVCYTLQIYFDFSGYSDMAIGLGKMAGFKFLENFNYPYISRSIQEFWRRWHISLSSWFRDYLYIPLGGNRGKPFRVYFNLFIVFLVCGMWHGAGWNFIVWGAWHGAFIVLEHSRFKNILNRLWSPLRHLYLLLIVMIGWVLFRSASLIYALNYLKAMCGLNSGDVSTYGLTGYLNNLTILILIIAIVISVPIFPKIADSKEKILAAFHEKGWHFLSAFEIGYSSIKYLSLGLVLSISFTFLSGTLSNPFIYFKF